MYLVRGLLLGVFLLFAATARGEYEEVQWDHGRVFVEDSRLVVVFNDGQRFFLQNTEFSPVESAMSAVSANVVLKGEATSQANDAIMFGLRNSQQGGVPIHGLKAIRIRMNDGSLALLWVGAERLTRAREGTMDGFLALTTIKSLSEHDWILKRFLDVRRAFPMYPSQLAVLRDSNGRHVLFSYDDWSAQLRVMFLFPDQEFDKSDRLRSEYEQVFPMPASFKQGRPFADAGTIEYDPEAVRRAILIKTKQGDILQMGGNEALQLEESDTKDYFESRKINSRINWAYGARAIREALPERAHENGAIEGAEQLASQVTEWLNKRRTKPKFRGQNGESGSSKAGEVLQLSVSKVMLDAIPGIREHVTSKVVDALASQPSVDLGEQVVYLRVPATFDTNGISGVARMLAQQMVLVKKNKPEVSLALLIDAVDVIGVDRHGNYDQVSEGIFRLLESTGVRNAKIILLHRMGDVKEEMLRRYVHDATEWPIDQFLTGTERVRAIYEGLRSKGYNLSMEMVQKVLRQVELDSLSKSALFSDLSEVLKNFTTVIHHLKLSPTDPEYVQNAAKLYAQITGERRVGPFPREMLERIQEIPRLLSTSYPGHSVNAMTGRDRLLNEIKDKILAWAAFGHKKSPTLPILFAGDNGTGKTMTANGIGEVLGAAVETVNLSAISKDRPYGFGVGSFRDSHNRSYPNEESREVKIIQEKIEQLVLDPNPRKILVLDELHTAPELLNHLLPAIGNSDRKASGVLNLDGIIVIMIMNVDVASEAYRDLSRDGSEGRQKSQLLFQLFKQSLAGKNSSVDEKLLGALGGRLLPGMFFFSPLGMDQLQQQNLLDTLIAEHEFENKIRIVVQDSARKHLKDVAASYVDGNYRSVERGLREEINGAFARYLIKKKGGNLEGYFVLSAGSSEGSENRLELLEVAGSETGIGEVIADVRKRFVSGVHASMQYAVNVFQTEERNVYIDASQRNFALMLDAFLQASRTSIANEMNPAGRLFPTPGNLDPKKHGAVDQYIVETVRDIFEAYAGEGKHQQDMSTKEALLSSAEGLNRVLAALIRMYRIELDSNSSKREFLDWVEQSRQRYLASNPDATLAKAVLEGSVDALAIAAGYLVDDVGRRFAAVMASDIKANAKKESFLRDSSDFQKGDLERSAECEKLLKGGQLAKDDLDRILDP